MWAFTVLLVIFIVMFVLKWKNRRYNALSKKFQSNLSTFPLLGVVHHFVGTDEDKMKAIQLAGRDALKRGGMTSVWLAHRFYLVVADPKIAKIFLRVCLEKDDVMQMCFKMIVGNGSITAPVSIWRPRRKLLMPYFSTRNLTQFVDVFAKQSQSMVDKLRPNVDTGSFPLYKYVSSFTLLSIFETTLGIDIKTQTDPKQLLTLIEKGMNVLVARGFQPWLYNEFVFKQTSYYKTLETIIDHVNDIADRILRSKREKKNESNNKAPEINDTSFKTLLDSLIESSGGKLGYTDTELKEEFVVLVVAGTDTTAISTCFTILMLSQYSHVQDQVYAELKEVFGDDNRILTAEDLSRLKYLELVIKETLRLYPPVPILLRRVNDDMTLPSGVVVPSGCGVVINVWALHRNDLYWGPDAELFRPERFLESEPKHPAQYMPFSFGPRNCAGSLYAMSAMKTLLATLLRQYRVLPADDSPQECKSLRLKFKLLAKEVDDFVVILKNR